MRDQRDGIACTEFSKRWRGPKRVSRANAGVTRRVMECRQHEREVCDGG